MGPGDTAARAGAARPLSGLRVLDLSRVLAGPWTAQLLADLGAEVIKVERPGTGDDTRGWGPPFAAAADGTPTRESAYFLSANRGKKSVAIDFGTASGQAMVRRLAARCDVLIENYKVGSLARAGLDHASLSEVNPGLVYCSITGFGQSGPYRDRRGYDFLVQAMGGLMSITGSPDGEPAKVGVAIADIMTGLYASSAILAALRERDRSGMGQHIDLALLDVQVSTLANEALNYLVSGREPARLGNAHPNIVPYQAFATLDGHIILAVGNDEQFRRFAACVGHPEFAQDPRFATNTMRILNRDALIPLIRDILATRSSGEWLGTLEAAGVPCGPINGLGAAFADAQIQARGMVQRIPHPLAGDIPTIANPIRYSRTPIAHDVPPPLLGQHTIEVLASVAGATASEIDALQRDGVIQTGEPIAAATG